MVKRLVSGLVGSGNTGALAAKLSGMSGMASMAGRLDCVVGLLTNSLIFHQVGSMHIAEHSLHQDYVQNDLFDRIVIVLHALYFVYCHACFTGNFKQF
jgi:hypothetical protein